MGYQSAVFVGRGGLSTAPNEAKGGRLLVRSQRLIRPSAIAKASILAGIYKVVDEAIDLGVGVAGRREA